MVKQTWKVTIENTSDEIESENAEMAIEEHIVEYACYRLSGKTVLTVDGEDFAVRGKPFGIGMKRQELVLVGSSRGVLDIEASGKATLTVDDGKVEAV